MKTPQDNQIKKEVNTFSGFTLHLSLYIAIMIIIWIIWLLTGGTLSFYAWPVYPTVAWGIVIVVHFFASMRVFREKKKRTSF